MNEPTRIDVNTFADLVGRSKRQIYKHIKNGTISATKPNRNTAYMIERSEVERFLREFGDNGSQDDTVNGHERSRTDVNRTTFDDATGHEPSRTGANSTTQGDMKVHEPSRTDVNPPTEVYSMMIDRIARAERRNVELEIILRQHQNLLTENAESLQEGRAEALQAEAKAELERKQREHKEGELEKALEELKEARAVIADWEERRSRPWWKKIFSAS